MGYAGPDPGLSFEIMLDILLAVVIGAMGTMYGAVIGSVLFVLAKNDLQDLTKLGCAGGGWRAAVGPVVGPTRLTPPLAAVVGPAVCAVGLPRSHRCGGQAAGAGVAPTRLNAYFFDNLFNQGTT